ncbi:tellurite resistance/C4-dicarboxylate transporter family protein [Kitasatospora sp. NPDC048286]|uniref:tellurite resistance/C4-dicarboxylate transporter family protein n=1 Tax=Kitasatospora sp. NPDC048286 TaxID=3364047 RepID=UPI00370F9128
MNSATSPRPARPHAPNGWWSTVPPAAGSAVMATGIVSVGLHLVGREVLSSVLLALAAGLWVLLAVAFALTFLNARGDWTLKAATPPALTAVASTGVLGTRISLLGHQGVALALLALAALVWPFLLASVVRHWRRGMPGAVFLVCVSTQALAVLAATIAAAGGPDRLAPAALAAFCLGLLLYLGALVRFDLRQILTGAGDQWVIAGALSISALAAGKLTALPDWTPGLHSALRAVTWVLLGLALAGYAVLLAAELRSPRPAYDLRRWATVFPLGMTAVAALVAATATGVDWLSPLGRVLLWVAAGAWLLTAAGFLATASRWPRVRRVLRRGR